MKRLLPITVCFILLVTGGWAQRTLTGTVTDTKGEPLYGVTIHTKSGKHTAVTDLNGNYKIVVNDENAVLLFRYMGMEPYQAAVKNQTVLNIKMKEQTTQLAEAVVVW